MAVVDSRREKEQDACMTSLLPDKNISALPCESKLTISNVLGIIDNPSYSQLFMDSPLNCEGCINLQSESAGVYPSSTVTVDIELGKLEAPTTNGDTARSLSFENAFCLIQRAICRQINTEIGGKLMQLLIASTLMILKFTSRGEKSTTESATVHDTPTHRSRKFKRSASFDSRKVVFLFSALSSMGTMVLIYLTLRVRQTGDGFVHG